MHIFVHNESMAVIVLIRIHPSANVASSGGVWSDQRIPCLLEIDQKPLRNKIQWHSPKSSLRLSPASKRGVFLRRNLAAGIEDSYRGPRVLL